MAIERQFKTVKNMKPFFLVAFGVFAMCPLHGDDMIKTIMPMRERPYVRGNARNGCCVFDTGGTNEFRVVACSESERIFAACVAMHHVRYGRNGQIPLDYYEKTFELIGDDHASNVVRKAELNFEQFSPPEGDRVVINGIAFDKMSIRVLSFMVRNTNSKADLRCMLVGFFHGETFCLAVYVNLNNGKVSLDFHDIAMEGYMLIAHESRYPYLTPNESDIQLKVYLKYFRKGQGATPFVRQSHFSDVNTNDVEVSVDL